MNLSKRTIIVLTLILGGVLHSNAQCPSFKNTLITPSKCESSCSLCVDDIIEITTQGSNLPDGADVNWYIDENSGFDPYSGDGTYIGSSSISTPTIACSPTPSFIGMMIDACGPEELNEFFVIDCGGGFNTDDIIFDFAPQNNGGPGNDDLGFGFPCELTAGDPTLVGGCDDVEGIGPGQDLPPGSILVVFTSQGSSNVYDMSGLCGTCRKIYIMTSTCSRSKGAYSNYRSTGIRTQTWNVGCTGGSVVYDCASLAGEGDQWIGGVVNGNCDFQGTAGPFELPSTITNFSTIVPSDWCDKDIELVGIVDPLDDLLGCCFEPYTKRFNFHIGCPEAEETNMTECDLGNGTATFDLNEIITTVQNGSNGMVRWYSDINLINEIFSPYTTAMTIIYAVVVDGDCVSAPVEITLNLIDLPIAEPTSMEECELVTNTMIGYFDLDNINATINGGSGLDVKYYFDPNKLQQITTRPFETGSTTIYATVCEGDCESLPVEITLTVHLKPFAFSTRLAKCEDPEGSEMAEFDLTDANDEVTGGVGSWTVRYYNNVDKDVEIFSPFETGTTIIYAVTENANCMSDPVPITLEVFTGISAKPKVFQQCAEHIDSVNGTFLAQDFYDRFNSGQFFEIFSDSMGKDIVTFPYYGGDTLFYGHSENDSCSVGLFRITVKITDPPEAMAVKDTACTDIMGNCYFDLDSIAKRVRKDSNLNVEFSETNSFVDLLTGLYKSRGDIIFARVDGNGCYSPTVRITLVCIITPILDQASKLLLCDSLVLPKITGMNLTMGVAYFTKLNGKGTKYVEGDVIYESDTLYAFDSRWNCFSEVEIHVTINQTPDAGDDNIVSVCKGTVVSLKTLINGDDGGYYVDLDNSKKLINGNLLTMGLIGSYRFKYIIDRISPCEGDSAIITINIVDAVTAGRNINISICQNDSVNLMLLLGNADPGGRFVDVDNSNALNGSIFNARKTVPGKWRVYYIVGDDITCPADTATITLDVLNALDIFPNRDISICEYFVLPTIIGIDLTGNEAYFSLAGGNGRLLRSGDTIRQDITLYIYDNSSGICPDEESFTIEILHSTSNDITGILCPENSLIVNGTTYYIKNPSGTEILEGKNSLGCDSIVTIALDFYPFATNDLTQTLCNGESMVVNSVLYDEFNPKGIETLENESTNGCDSVITIDLTFIPFPTGNDFRTVCKEDTVRINGTDYHFNHTSGIDTIKAGSVDGCDSIVNVSLDFHNARSNLSQSICGDEIILIGNKIFDRNNLSGVVVIENGSVNGCDSIINVMLTFNSIGVNNYSGELCKGNSIVINGTTYSQSNPTGIDTLKNASSTGCDSIINIDLKFLDAVSSALKVDLCRSESIIINGTTYDENNISGSDTLINGSINGCDSIINVILVILEPSSSELNLKLCNGESIVINGKTFNEENPNDVQILQNAASNGCDSTIIINLSFDDYFVESTQTEYKIIAGDIISLSLTTDMNYTSISWNPADGLSCSDCLNPTASPIVTTTYTITLTDDNGCEISTRITVIVQKNDQVFVPNTFSPNGDGINDNFRVFAAKGISQINSFNIYDRWGELIYQELNTDVYDRQSHLGWNGQFRAKELNSGVFVYVISVKLNNGQDVLYNGSLTLLK